MRVLGQHHRTHSELPQTISRFLAHRRVIGSAGLLIAGATVLALAIVVGPAGGRGSRQHGRPADVQVYAGSVQNQIADLQASVNELSPLLSDEMSPATAVVLLGDAAHRTEQVSAEAQALTAPSCLATVQRHYVAVVARLDAGVSDGVAAAQANNAALLSRAGDEIRLDAGQLALVRTSLTPAKC